MDRVLGDRYEIGAPLGSGGMAEVFSASDRVLHRTVAVKILASRFAGDDRFVTRFRREAQASARLNHPNIVSVFDTGSEDGTHYIVMELIEGRTLSEVLAQEAPLEPTQAVEIGAAVAAALEAAHREGLVHRDVKPGNVMLTPAGQVKVMDFGIARAAADDTLTQTGTVLGTASYLSPEQAAGEPVDARSDVYSLGCVLYEMLTGRAPFVGEGPMAIAYQQIHGTPRPPSELRPGIPRELEGVVLRALSKDRDGRYASGAALGDAIVAAVATEPTESRGDTAVLPPAAAAAPGPPSGRHRWIALVAAIVAVAGLAALGFALIGNGEEARRRDRPAERPASPTLETTGPAEAPTGSPSESPTESPSPPGDEGDDDDEGNGHGKSMGKGKGKRKGNSDK